MAPPEPVALVGQSVPLSRARMRTSRIEEHGQAAWAAFTVAADGAAIGSVDALIRRRNYGPPYAEGASASDYAPLPRAHGTSREAMMAAAGQFMAAIDANVAPPELLDAQCQWSVNGQGAGPCAAAFGSPPLARVAAVRDRQVLAVDEARGLVVVRFFEDIPAADGNGYPLTYQVIELYRIEAGRVVRVEAFTSELPNGMQPLEQR